MPCSTGRASHILLKKDCQAGCSCCPISSFSVGKLCCDEPKDNGSGNIARNAICAVITDAGVLFDNQNTPEAVSGLLCTLEYPSNECAVDVQLQQGNGSLIPLNTIFRGACIGVNTDDQTLADGEWKFIIDGTYECTTFNIIP